MVRHRYVTRKFLGLYCAPLFLWFLSISPILLAAIPQAVAADIRAISSICFFGSRCADEARYRLIMECCIDSILISGEIQRGDAEKFFQIITVHRGKIAKVILRSPGGSIDDALKIGRIVRNLLLETEGPKLDYSIAENWGYAGNERPLCFENGIIPELPASRYKGTQCSCSSACFLVYVAGVRRNAAFLGIHRAYRSKTDYERMGVDDAIRSHSAIEARIRRFLEDMGVAQRYGDIMFGVGSGEMWIIPYPLIVSDLMGWASTIEEWLLARCGAVSDRETEAQENEIFSKRPFDKEALENLLLLRAKWDQCYDEQLANSREERQKNFDSREALAPR